MGSLPRRQTDRDQGNSNLLLEVPGFSRGFWDFFSIVDWGRPYRFPTLLRLRYSRSFDFGPKLATMTYLDKTYTLLLRNALDILFLRFVFLSSFWETGTGRDVRRRYVTVSIWFLGPPFRVVMRRLSSNNCSVSSLLFSLDLRVSVIELTVFTDLLPLKFYKTKRNKNKYGLDH